MNSLLYGVLAIFSITLVLDMVVRFITRLIINFTGAETPPWAEQFLVIARHWRDGW